MAPPGRHRISLDFLTSLRYLNAQSLSMNPLYPRFFLRGDEKRFNKKISELGEKQDNAEELKEMTEVGMRLYHFYLQKDVSKAYDISLLVSTTLKKILEKDRSGDGQKERARLEAINRYWESKAAIANVNQLTARKDKLKQSAKSSLNKGKPEDAHKDLETLLDELKKTEDESGMAVALLEFAEDCKKSGNLEMSLDSHLKAADIDPRSWFDVGFTLTELSRWSDSIDAYKKFLQEFPNDANAWCNLGISYQNLEDFSKSLECFVRALKLNKKLAAAWSGKGFTLLKLGKPKEASKAYIEALKINPKDQVSLVNLTSIHNDILHNYNDALAYAQKAYEINPNESASVNLAETLVIAGRYNEGRRMAENALKLDIDPSWRLAMHIVILSSYYLDGNVKEGENCFQYLDSFRESLPHNFVNSWSYDAISTSITKSDMEVNSKRKILEAINRAAKAELKSSSTEVTSQS